MSSDQSHSLYYRTRQSPPIGSAFLFAFQQVMVCASAAMTGPLVVADQICASRVPLGRVKIVGTMLFVSGISTVIQTLFGTRLSLLQGGSFAFLPPVAAFSKLHPCPEFNGTITDEVENEWMSKMRVIQGCLILASLVQIIIGATGLIGLLTRYIGPLTIAPLMLLLQVSTIGICLDYAQQHWISLVLIILLLSTALYLSQIKVPLVGFNRSGWRVYWQPVFAMFPYLIAILFTWFLAAILTATDSIASNSTARTDYRSSVLTEAPWFRIPYPGQWGTPQISIGLFLGFVAASIASTIESVGDYHACARVSLETPPPAHAVNRGILVEGICCFMSGFFGGGLALTTYSENVGVIGITKVASRRTMQLAGAILIFLGMFSKFGAVIGTLPDPLVGGILSISLAMVGGVGLSSVQLLDLKLTRNIAILGIAISLGIMIPMYVARFPIKTGSTTLDDVLIILLSIEMLVGGVIGFILDNTVPGASREERGLAPWKTNTVGSKVYGFPRRVQNVINRIPGSRFLPFLPNFSLKSTVTTVEPQPLT